MDLVPYVLVSMFLSVPMLEILSFLARILFWDWFDIDLEWLENGVIIFGHITVWLIFMYLCFIILPTGSPIWISLLLVFLYFIIPIAHPCDYRSYKLWWADRRNWHRNLHRNFLP